MIATDAIAADTNAAAEEDERSAAELSLDADALSAIFLRLPPKEQVLTIGALSAAWRRWAAQRLGAYWAGILPSERALAAERAARDGNTAALDWALTAAHDGGVAWSEKHVNAAAGSVRALEWLRDHHLPSSWDRIWAGRARDAALAGSHVETRKWLRAQQPPCRMPCERACEVAASGGHLETLQWLRAQHPPCTWSSGVWIEAAHGGHIEVLKLLRAQQPPCPG